MNVQNMAKQLAESQAETKRVWESLETANDQIAAIGAEKDALKLQLTATRARLAGAAVNEARYLFLRESGLEIAWNAQVSYSPSYMENDATVMDAAIDAAIAAHKGEG